MKITFSDIKWPKTGTLVLGVYEGKVDTSHAHEADKMTGGLLHRAIEASYFTGKSKDSLTLLAPNGIPISRIILVGLGTSKSLTSQSLEELGGKIYTLLEKGPDLEACVMIPDIKSNDIDCEAAIALMASGALLRSWRFDKYRTQEKKENKPHLKTLTFTTPNMEKTQQFFERSESIAEGVFLTRHVTAEPPNVLYPESFAKIAQELEKIGVKVEIFGEKEMKKLGMNTLLGVGQGSIRESQLVVLQWMGGKKDQAPVAIVGKGVTFDTGGISIKPAASMDEMKWDMAGAGVVLGLLKTLAKRKAKVNVIGVMGLAENMPSGSAQRPGDIVTSMSGQTIEVLNTDAEGRLLLADALWYTQDRFKPQAMINLATLTMAIVIALGHYRAGLFSNDDTLAAKLSAAGEATGELLWRLPLSESYDKELNSDVADVKNIGSGREGGSIRAAQFLQRFVNKTSWAHLDIAGVAWQDKDQPLSEKGATAFGVRLLNHFIHEEYEK